jgi:hypothetical protein
LSYDGASQLTREFVARPENLSENRENRRETRKFTIRRANFLENIRWFALQPSPSGRFGGSESWAWERPTDRRSPGNIGQRVHMCLEGTHRIHHAAP